MRTEDEIGGRGGPLDVTRRTVATLIYVLRLTGWLPVRVHVEEVHVKIVGQRAWTLGEDAMWRLANIGAERAHAANEDGHLGRGQPQHVGTIQQQRFRGQRLPRAKVV